MRTVGTSSDAVLVAAIGHLLSICDQRPETIAALLVIVEHVEAGARRRKQNRITLLRQITRALYDISKLPSTSSTETCSLRSCTISGAASPYAIT